MPVVQLISLFLNALFNEYELILATGVVSPVSVRHKASHKAIMKTVEKNILFSSRDKIKRDVASFATRHLQRELSEREMAILNILLNSQEFAVARSEAAIEFDRRCNQKSATERQNDRRDLGTGCLAADRKRDAGWERQSSGSD